MKGDSSNLLLLIVTAVANGAAFAASSPLLMNNPTLLVKGGSMRTNMEQGTNGTASVTNSTSTMAFSFAVPDAPTVAPQSDMIIPSHVENCEEEHQPSQLSSCITEQQIQPPRKPLKVLFLSADTGGGHRASAESLANQFMKHYPGSEYDLLDVWTPTKVYPYTTLVKSYKHLSAHPLQWKLLYHVSNTRAYAKFTDIHSNRLCRDKVKREMERFDPDVVVSVHPTMNYLPEKITRELAKSKGKNVPFFTVVTDFGSGHCTWFHKDVDKMYIASDKIEELAKKRGSIADEKIFMSGLPIRDAFAAQSDAMIDRTTTEGKQYRREMKVKLGLDPEKKVILAMGGGEGVGSLSLIAEKMQVEMKASGVDATILVICGRNEALKEEINSRDWETFIPRKSKRSKLARKMFRKKRIAEERISNAKGNVDVIGLGFVDNMAEVMVAADVLVSKAGPGTIAEAAAVGLPVMITSFLPGQEAGNVDIVLDGEFGAFSQKPRKIAKAVTEWVQDESMLDELSRNSARVGNPHAASNIVLDIGRITEEMMKQNQELAIKND